MVCSGRVGLLKITTNATPSRELGSLSIAKLVIPPPDPNLFRPAGHVARAVLRSQQSLPAGGSAAW